MLCTLTLMNMLLGIICEVMTNVANDEKDGIAMKLVTEEIRKCLKGTDCENISKDKFEKIITDRGAARALTHVKVDVPALLDFAEYLFQSDAKGECFDRILTFDDFMDVIMQVRG